MGRPQMSLDAQKLLIEGPGGVGRNLRATCSPCLAISLDGLCDCLRVAREEACQDKKETGQSQKSARPTVGGSKETKKLTIDEVLDLMEAGSQLRLLVGPGGALALKLGQEHSLFLLCLLLRLLEQLLLLRQLRD